MIHTDRRKLCLAAWLKEKNLAAYLSPLKLQKFLFLYEAFSKIAGDSYDFGHLKGYARGPVFSNVWGDYTKDREEFEAAMSECGTEHNHINAQRANKAAFVASVLTERELSQLTHKLDIWQTQKERIMLGQKQVELKDSDFSQSDTELLAQLYNMYDEKLIENSILIPVDDKNFVFSKNDARKLTEQQMDTLEALSQHTELHNPVFVTIDKEGALVVD